MYNSKQISYVFHTTLFIKEKENVFLFINIVLWLMVVLFSFLCLKYKWHGSVGL